MTPLKVEHERPIYAMTAATALTIVAANLRLHIREREARLAARQRALDDDWVEWETLRHESPQWELMVCFAHGTGQDRLYTARYNLSENSRYSRQTIALLRATCRRLSRTSVDQRGIDEMLSYPAAIEDDIVPDLV